MSLLPCRKKATPQGRLWHMPLLSKRSFAFACLPVGSIVHDRQQDYYEAINASNAAESSTVFIGFMISAIKASRILIESMSMRDKMSDMSRVARRSDGL